MPKLSMVMYKCGKTINLAKPNSYQIPRKPPLNTLIFEKLPEPRCGDKITCGIKGPPITKPVRVCTKEDMQSFYCPPVPCDCKIKPPPLTLAQKMGLLCKETLKALMVGGMIYYTYQEGLWSDAFRSSCFIGKFVEKCPKEDEGEENEYADIRNIVLDDPEPCQPFIPHSGLMLYRIGYVWNQVVIYTFWFVLDAPGEILEAFKAFCRGKPKPEAAPMCVQAPPPT